MIILYSIYIYVIVYIYIYIYILYFSIIYYWEELDGNGVGIWDGSWEGGWENSRWC